MAAKTTYQFYKVSFINDPKPEDFHLIGVDSKNCVVSFDYMEINEDNFMQFNVSDFKVYEKLEMFNDKNG